MSKDASTETNPIRMLLLIAQGYFSHSEYDRFVICVNPEYQEDNGHDPQIVFDTYGYDASYVFKPVATTIGGGDA